MEKYFRVHSHIFLKPEFLFLQEFELRKHARNEGRRYCDPGVLTYQAERMPEQIRLKVGGVTPQQIAVYEEFARNIPGFLAAPPITTPETLFNKPAQVYGMESSCFVKKIYSESRYNCSAVTYI